MSDSKSNVQALKKAGHTEKRTSIEAQIKNEKLLSADQARDLFLVKEGRLVNRVMRGRRALPGMYAGSINGDGYLRVKVNNVSYRAHRVVWLITYGRWPVGQIDHINGVRDDNRIENLREVSVQDNQRNQHIRKDNTSGASGVSAESGGWRSRIKINGKHVNVGFFADFDSAVSARKDAETLHGFHPNHGATDHQRRTSSSKQEIA